MKKLQAIIKKPCSENWDKMTPNEQGRHCEKCALTVIDFTQMAEEEIIQTLQARVGQRTCGRMKVKPARHTLPEQIIHPQIQRSSWKLPHGLYTLSLATLLLSSCNYFPGNHVTGEVGQVEIMGKMIQVDSSESHTPQNLSDTLALFSSPDTGKRDSAEIIKKIVCPPAPVDPIGTDFLGDVIVSEPIDIPEPVFTSGISIIQEDTPSITHKMPMFPGGEDSLKAFILANLNYPKQERDLEIEGKIILTFVVSAEGELLNIQVVRSVPGAPNFDKEAIRVLNLMPKWIPAEDYKGNPTMVRSALPIRFTLK